MSTPHYPLRRISAKINTTLLAGFLNGTLSWGQMLRKGTPSRNMGMPAGTLPNGMVLGFIPNADYPSDILLTTTPLRDDLIRTAALAYKSGRWFASPQLVAARALTEYQAIEIERVDWILALAILADEFRPQRGTGTIDFTSWSIVVAWPEWEAAGLPWKKRAADLAKRLGTIPLPPNTLMIKCKRMGLMLV